MKVSARTMDQLVMNTSLRIVSVHVTVTLELTLGWPDPDHVLCPPYEKVPKLDLDLQERIARYFGQIFGKQSAEVKKQLPTAALFTAGKLRIWHGGDLFWTTQVSRRLGALERRNCYVRVRPLSYSDTNL